MKVKIKITEVLSRKVEALLESEAEDKAQKMYKKEKIVLDWSDFEGKTSFEIIR